MSLTRKIYEITANYSNPLSLGSKLRAKRLKHLISMIKIAFEAYGNVNIIDIGGTKTYWQMLPHHILRDNNVTITIINLPGVNQPANDQCFKFIEGNGCDLSFYEDNSFHIAHSNSVIEHVGDWQSMVKFAHEVRRIAPNIFIQTPYFWFPIEPHFMCPFFHWLPIPVRINIIMRFDLASHKRARSISEAIRIIEGRRLLDIKMFQELFPDAEIIKEKFAFFTKSLIAVREKKCNV